MGMVENAHVDLAVVQQDLGAAVLGKAPLGDVHARPQLQVRNHRQEHAQRRRLDVMQHAVDAKANAKAPWNISKWMSDARASAARAISVFTQAHHRCILGDGPQRLQAVVEVGLFVLFVCIAFRENARRPLGLGPTADEFRHSRIDPGPRRQQHLDRNADELPQRVQRNHVERHGAGDAQRAFGHAQRQDAVVRQEWQRNIFGTAPAWGQASAPSTGYPVSSADRCNRRLSAARVRSGAPGINDKAHQDARRRRRRGSSGARGIAAVPTQVTGRDIQSSV